MLFGLLLLPWALFALYSPMAFDAWPQHKADVIFFSVALYSYPLMLLMAYLLSKRYVLLSLLPAVNIAALFLQGRL